MADKTVFAKVLSKVDPKNQIGGVSTRQRTKYLHSENLKPEHFKRLKMTVELREKVVPFYENDLNFTAAPGIKDVERKNKQAYRKRFLREPVYILHEHSVRKLEVKYSNVLSVETMLCFTAKSRIW